MSGGGGVDTFKFTTANDSLLAAPDTIADFQTGGNGAVDLHIHATGTNAVVAADVVWSSPSRAAVRTASRAGTKALISPKARSGRGEHQGS